MLHLYNASSKQAHAYATLMANTLSVDYYVVQKGSTHIIGKMINMMTYTGGVICSAKL